MNLRKYILLLLFTIGIICVNAQTPNFYIGGKSDPGTGITGLRVNLAANTCVLYYDTTVIFYHGGSYGGAANNTINSITCPFIIDTAASFYHGGSYGGAATNSITPTICATSIDTTVIFYRGGSYGGAATNTILPSICDFVLDSTVIFYHGGSYGSNASIALTPTTCAIPDPTNIYMGGNSSNNAPGTIAATTANNTSGPFMTSIENAIITNGNCVTLTTTGTGATGYSWSPSIGLNSASIASPVASPSTTTTYTLTASGSAGCRSVFSVVVTVASGNESGTTISYPAALISKSITTPQSVILTGITGGVYSPSSANLKINAVTGEITPNTSTAGTYTVNYTYGTCSNTATTSVIITTDAATHGEVNYPNFYLGATSPTTSAKLFVTQSTCVIPLDYTLMIFSGGTSGAAVPRNLLTASSCSANIDYSVSFYVGGISATTAPNKLIQGACTPYINPSNTIFMGGASSSATAKVTLIPNFCNYPVGDNFYMGGSGVGYGNGSLTPTTGTSAGTAVATLSDFTICPGVSTTLTTTGATNYVWTPATGLSSSLVASPIANPLSTTTYTVTGSGAGVGCFNTAKVTVTVLKDNLTSISYGAYRFDETNMSLAKVNFIIGPLTGIFSATPTGLFYDQNSGAFTPGLSSSGLYTIYYNYTKAGCNYSYPVNINITTLPPTIIYPSPSIFYLNYSSISVSPTNSGGQAFGYQLLDSLPAGLKMDTVSGVISGTPSVLINNAAIKVRAFNYNKLGGNNYSDTYTMNLSVYKPVISTTTITADGMNGTYGNASSPSTINVSGRYIVQNITITPPTGFEVSANAITGFANTVSIIQSGGTITNTNVYIRLKTTASVGNYSGTIKLTSYAADSILISMATSSVAASPLTVTASYFQKFYGSTISLGTGATNFTSSGLYNNETIGSVTLTPNGGFTPDSPPGFYDITPTDATGGTFSPSNYTITYVPGQFEVLYSLYNFNMTGNTSNWVKGKVPIPKIVAGVLSNITNAGASYDCTISSAYSKLSQKGVCWSTSVNPTIDNDYSTDSSPGTGPMTLYLTGLNSGTTYYARTFIKVGNYVYYGPNIKFTTTY